MGRNLYVAKQLVQYGTAKPIEIAALIKLLIENEVEDYHFSEGETYLKIGEFEFSVFLAKIKEKHAKIYKLLSEMAKEADTSHRYYVFYYF